MRAVQITSDDRDFESRSAGFQWIEVAVVEERGGESVHFISAEEDD